jgi:hypothetical protein
LNINKAARLLLAQKVRRTWQKELESMISFIERLQALKVPEADSWAEGQAKYFYNRIELYLATTPDGATEQAKAFRRRLEKLTIFR